MKKTLAVLILLICGVFSSRSSAQGFELNGGWAHSTGDFGVDGFEVGGAVWMSHKVAIAVNYDDMYDTSQVGAFELSSIGTTSIKSHLQNFLVGPRVYFAKKKIKKYAISPFAEVQFGGSHLNSTIHQVGLADQSASDSGFSWALGGGADYILSPHWTARANFDLLRTHFVDSGQSRLRFVLGVAYSFGQR